MKISSAEFTKSAFDESHWTTDGRKEISFLGRSNVGKSSLINSLLNKKGLARTSNTPGRTQSINFFLVNESFYFTDLPGYGYAKVSKTVRQSWGKMAEDYLSKRDELVLSVQLIDVRHPPMPLDRELQEWLIYNDRPHIVVATKADKLSNNQLKKSLDEIRQIMPESTVIPYSSLTGKGKDEIWREIENALKG
jgi:GTP-binding protein